MWKQARGDVGINESYPRWTPDSTETTAEDGRGFFPGVLE